MQYKARRAGRYASAPQNQEASTRNTAAERPSHPGRYYRHATAWGRHMHCEAMTLTQSHMMHPSTFYKYIQNRRTPTRQSFSSTKACPRRRYGGCRTCSAHVVKRTGDDSSNTRKVGICRLWVTVHPTPPTMPCARPHMDRSTYIRGGTGTATRHGAKPRAPQGPPAPTPAARQPLLLSLGAGRAPAPA